MIERHLVTAHKTLLEADNTYANDPNLHTHNAVCSAQRAYYRLLLTYTKAHYPLHIARVRFTYANLQRAQQNAKRLPTNQEWQQVAAMQVRQAKLTYWRALAIAEQVQYEPPPAAHLKAPKPAKALRRIVHPITRRYVYVPTNQQ